ncbi:hypothetical protein TREMEDRAFT_65356 [Tremella mesenterica DSM 1558]|uniref:uncharacterized protein n=1 Tax=Tremella mesenterica (strain ATCC 24925 / CBS 8224 / DSM 1558 / NBRC 9311 / NRRL Y-6157 / RJB 2259-6 / UBC 559-6) TaxID=578456 RepID=UPI00032BBF99|nr:uncharacterized protein TREMEDRAFT_65356 [Tremella mesenterica DSM 1558]EIW66494.1 hypothetical protein TREMEDRAFT_65356 [Tremella mesenterica DSM 1558]
MAAGRAASRVASTGFSIASSVSRSTRTSVLPTFTRSQGGGGTRNRSARRILDHVSGASDLLADGFSRLNPPDELVEDDSVFSDALSVGLSSAQSFFAASPLPKKALRNASSVVSALKLARNVMASALSSTRPPSTIPRTISNTGVSSSKPASAFRVSIMKDPWGQNMSQFTPTDYHFQSNPSHGPSSAVSSSIFTAFADPPQSPNGDLSDERTSTGGRYTGADTGYSGPIPSIHINGSSFPTSEEGEELPPSCLTTGEHSLTLNVSYNDTLPPEAWSCALCGRLPDWTRSDLRELDQVRRTHWVSAQSYYSTNGYFLGINVSVWVGDDQEIGPQYTKSNFEDAYPTEIEADNDATLYE